MKDANKHALITGGTSGIGFELAKLFAQDGYHLVIVARSRQELEQTAKELQQLYGVQVHSIQKDLFQPEAPFEVCDEVSARGIKIDVLVNNAGQGQHGEFVDTDIHRELDIIRLNIDAYVVLTKHFLQQMMARQEGKILNVASIASKSPGPWQAVYHATKAFVLSFTEAVQNEIKDSQVTITSLLPGATNTDFFRKADMTDAVVVQEGSLADAASVAKDGYDALMKGEHKVISGMKNKLNVALGNLMPDSMVAENMRKQNQPVSEKS